MLKLDDLEKVNQELFTFVWDFKHGDNIMYNFEVLRSLYFAKAADPKPSLLNKPITISVVSILEAILVDFLSRIDAATAHLPQGIDAGKIKDMKAEIEKKKQPVKVEDDIFGEHIFMKRKMYNYNKIVKIFQKYEVFGDKNDEIYKKLSMFGDMRNRVHIENYHRNFEDREEHVFTDVRLDGLEDLLRSLWTKMTADYRRPWA
jgi:hypothetical protein